MTSSRRLSDTKYLKVLGHIGAVITVSAWGSSFIATKVLMEQGGFSPVEMYIYRFAAAYLLLLLFTFRKFLSNSLRDELQFLICGVCAGSLYFITENYALQHTTAGNVSLLSSLSPIFTTILMATFFRTKIGAGVMIGSVVAAVGVACVVFSQGAGLEIHPLGDLLALSSALSWAVYSIVVKKLIPHYTTLFITRKLFFYGVLTAIPFFFATQGGDYHLSLLFSIDHPTFLASFLFLVVLCSMAAYIIWNESMKILGPVQANNYIYMQPLVTMVAAYFVLGESISILGYIGCALIIGGLVVADKLNLEGIRFIRK